MERNARQGAAATANGAAMAAVLAAGIGALAMGMFVILNAAGIFSAPSLYGPVGGLSGRSSVAVVGWLITWAALHWRWRGRDLAPRKILGWTMLLIALAVAMTFPPVWGLL